MPIKRVENLNLEGETYYEKENFRYYCSNIDKRYLESDVGGTMGRGCAEKSAGLAKEFQKIAELMGCQFMDADSVITASVNDIDYMHLTMEGHRQLADALAERILESL